MNKKKRVGYQPNLWTNTHPLYSKPEGYMGKVRICGIEYKFRLLGHYCNNTCHLDLWNDNTPMFSMNTPYMSIELLEDEPSTPAQQ